jgi:type III secretion protein N (ATPase)
LLAQIVRNTEADVTVLALIGERGREVREFIEKDLGPEGLARSVVICSTSDRSAMERLKAAYVATSIAESFRDKGKKVLLLMDSVTRFGRAQREIGLAAGEPPTRRGFPPSVFSELPKLMERAGNSAKGSITALYTVLVEGDDMTEPIADETRSILDGHIVLSRKLAQMNHYPAIDILQSISRCQNAIIDADHKKDAAHLREILAKYAEVELLLKIGEYQKGADRETDEAVAKIGRVNAFLRQGLFERLTYAETIAKLAEAVR